MPKREKYDRCISLPFLTKNRPICPSQFSFFAENGELPFCIYVTALNDDDNNFEQSLRPLNSKKRQKATLFCCHTFTMIGGGVDEAKRASRVRVRVRKLLKECPIRQLRWWFQTLVTFTMGPLRFLRLNGPVVSEFVFWTSPK